MSNFDEQLSFLRSLIRGRSFCDATIRFLESLLVSKDVKSFIEVRSSLTHFLRSEAISVIRSIAVKTVYEKLLVLEFFVRAFALVGDQQSCLALRYEALVMREFKSASCQWLQVSPVEWLRFLEDAVRNGFHAVAEKVAPLYNQRRGKKKYSIGLCVLELRNWKFWGNFIIFLIFLALDLALYFWFFI